MSLDLNTLRKVVESDPDDSMMRFALGQKIYDEVQTRDGLMEAAGHFRFSWQASPENAVYGYKLGLVLADLGEEEEARSVLKASLECARVSNEGEGHDLVPAIEDALDSLSD